MIENVLTDDKWLELKCVVCSMFLSVYPIGVIEDGTNVCGRCYSKYEEINKGKILIRAIALEKFLAKILIPCSYCVHGCKRMLVLDKCQDHEERCTYKIYACPSTPMKNACDWSGTAGEALLKHFQENHKDLLLNEVGKFDLDLSKDLQKNYLYLCLNQQFLVQFTVSVEQNALHGCVKFLGPSRRAEDYVYNFEFSDSSNVSSFVNAVNTKGKHCESDRILLKLDEHSSIPVIINEILFKVGFDSRLSCTVKIQKGERRRSNTPEVINEMIKCEWPGCNKVLSIEHNQKHMESCFHRTIRCKWLGCNMVCRGNEIERHQDVCDHRIHSCRWDGCTDLIPYKNIEEHEEVCEKRTQAHFECNVINEESGHCDASLPLQELITHVKENHSDVYVSDFQVTKCEPLWSGNEFFMLCYEEFFRCKCIFACGIDGFKFEAILYGTEKEARNFRLEVEILSPCDSKENFVLHSDVVSFHSKIPKYAHVESVRPIRHYIQRNKLLFTFRIFKRII